MQKSGRKTALIIVDIQSGFITDENKWILPNVKKLLTEEVYDLYIEATFHADPGSLWDKQTEWTFPYEPTMPDIKSLIPERAVQVIKATKSVFGGDKDVVKILKENDIEEVHIIGLDTNDCVMATAFDAFDAGFFTYVIEDCTESSNGSHLRDTALEILRNVDLTLKMK